MLSKDFVSAGNAIFTVVLNNGEHMTYRISRPTRDKFGYKLSPEELAKKPFFIGKLAGPQNTSDYSYLGILALPEYQVKLTQKSNYTADSVATKVLQQALDIMAGRLDILESRIADIMHCGFCGRCGRLLTVPESIESGIGPECAGKMEMAAAIAALGY